MIFPLTTLQEKGNALNLEQIMNSVVLIRTTNPVQELAYEKQKILK